jgi:hypothetical protein
VLESHWDATLCAQRRSKRNYLWAGCPNSNHLLYTRPPIDRLRGFISLCEEPGEQPTIKCLPGQKCSKATECVLAWNVKSILALFGSSPSAGSNERMTMLTLGTIILMIPVVAALDAYDELRRRRTGLPGRRQDLRKKTRRSAHKPTRS